MNKLVKSLAQGETPDASILANLSCSFLLPNNTAVESPAV